MKQVYSPIQESQTKIKPIIKKQYGSKFSGSGYQGFNYSPQVNPRILLEYDRVRREEPIVKQGIEIYKYFVLGSIGEYCHTDPEKEKFIRYNLDNLPGGWKSHLGKLFQTMMWAGFAVAEQINTPYKGKVFISNLAHYNPITIYFKLDEKGNLTEGNAPATILSTYFPLETDKSTNKSGLYQVGGSLTKGTVQLPLRKMVFCTHDPDLRSGPLGTSVIEGGTYRNHVLKQAFQDMEATAFDRYGSPLIYLQVPTGQSDIKDLDSMGQPYFLSTYEAAKRNVEDFNSTKALVFTYGDEKRKVDINTLTTGNNFANSFDLAKKYCDSEMLMSMSIPTVLVKQEGGSILSGSGAAEKQMELFANIVEGLIPELLIPFEKTVIASLLQMNYGDDPNGYIGSFKKNELNPKDILLSVTTMKTATELGYMNPTNSEDWKEFRRIAGLPGREPTKEDLKYATDIKKVTAGSNQTKTKKASSLLKEATDSVTQS
jgi:hypothetical protein